MSEEKVEFEVESDPVEIEVVDDTPPEDRNRPPMKDEPSEVTEDELQSYNESVRKRIKHFSRGYHEERRAKEAALREREEAARLLQATLEENRKLKSTVSQNQEALLEQAKRATQVELDKAKEEYKKAYDMGDSDALVAAQENLTAAKIKADRVANFKLPPLQEEEPKLKPEQQAPVYDPKAAEWASKNSWYGTDQRMTTYAWAVHDDMTKAGIPVGSDEYWNKLDAEIRQRFPEQFEPSDAPPQKKPSVVAPATRSTAPKKIVLTQSQVNVAKRLGVSLQEYAQQLALLNKGNA